MCIRDRNPPTATMRETMSLQLRRGASGGSSTSTSRPFSSIDAPSAGTSTPSVADQPFPSIQITVELAPIAGYRMGCSVEFGAGTVSLWDGFRGCLLYTSDAAD